MRTTQLKDDVSLKEQELRELELRLSAQQRDNEKLADDLKAREKRVEELESILEEQKKAVTDLKSKVADALLGFNEGDLNVEVKEGKVYVSMASQLLFKSGSITVDRKGEDALKKLANALSSNKDLTIVVEGHTDDQPMSKKSNYMKAVSYTHLTLPTTSRV